MALSASNNTPRVGDDAISTRLAFGVKATSQIYEGGIVVLSSGYAKAATAATGLIAVGVALRDVLGLSTDGAVNVEVRSGAFWVHNNDAGSDAVVAADVGATVYLESDISVCHTASGKSAAGKCLAIDSVKGVLVQIALY